MWQSTRLMVEVQQFRLGIQYRPMVWGHNYENSLPRYLVGSLAHYLLLQKARLQEKKN